ncbi:WbqC family protein [Maribacter sp. 2210JD10-5]|uniref:WbqC family protein n=1 Tax=Maribacter sp. 2210JD10-5 TaxID=3386272 RepID=UPI0039BD8575
MKALLHPTYFPTIHSFSIQLNHDVIWEIYDNYQKQTYRNRTYICTDRGKHMLSIPIVHVGNATGRQVYRNIKLDNSYKWQRQHWRTLETAYRTSPFFEFYEDDIKPLFEVSFDTLMNFNFETIKTICDCLQVPISNRQTEYFETTPKNVRDLRFLANAKRQHFSPNPEYMQVFNSKHGFVPNLSILDLLFNLGPNTSSYLKALDMTSENA